ncbi:hypothetical protein Godav_003920 [Gossypium davidsonii]|uniref:Uncharacterized protein n=2 Tax=Gossypium TaxID=3633 RepID=A0A7J8SJY5_GOSDV|nr:hypothetical protein [Gossypium davidsonii]MBA0661815.1 hypothetical protein [Gossypium klotzschianum]
MMRKVTKVKTSKCKRNILRPGSHVTAPEPYVVTLDDPQNRMARFCTSVSSPSIEFQEIDIDKYLQQPQPYTFIQEQGFDPVMRNYKGVWEIAIEREWNKFCLSPEEPIIILVV